MPTSSYTLICSSSHLLQIEGDPAIRESTPEINMNKSQSNDLLKAKQSVLIKSDAVEEGVAEVRGYDFNQGINFEKLFDSYGTTGIQATHMAMIIEEINKMISERERVFLADESIEPCFPYPIARKKKALTLFLGYTSNLVTSGLREIFRFLAQHNLVDCIVTSAGGVEEDIIKCLKATYIGNFKMCGAKLREKGLNRAGNMLIPNDNYCAFEEWLMPILDECLREQQIAIDPVCWTPSKLIHRLGKEISNEDSICYWAFKNNIPSWIRLDIVEDLRHINTMAVKSLKTGVIILGGGFVKHHINNANLMRNGSDYTVYINTGQEFDGSDSGAEPDEALVADATLVFPIIVARTFAKRLHSR
uniref:Deoxyhypusine synthase n=1 Tax=Ditylenchus dipsaci TaxID=166011 RepID=A0A915CL44_9BILA